MPEIHPIAHAVMGFFLLLVVIEISRYTYGAFGFRRGWVRIPIPIFFLLSFCVCSLSGLFLLALGPKDALLALALGCGITLSLFHPVAATAFFISCLLLRPWEVILFNPVLDLVPRLLAGVSIASWALSRLLRRKMTFVWNRSLTLFSLLFLWLVISAAVSPNSTENVSVIFRTFLPVFIVCVLILNSAEAEADLALIKRCLGLALSGVIGVAIVLTGTDPKFFSEGLRLQGAGLTSNSNDLAALSVLAFPFLIISFVNRWKFRKFSWLDVLCSGTLLLGLLMTRSRAGVIALGAACLLYTFMVSKSVLRIVIRISFALPILAVFMMFAMKRSAEDLDQSSDSRWNYILTAFRMLKDHPFMGVGVGNYPRFYDQYTQLYLETGHRTVHSTWMLLFVETGPIGLGLFAGLFFSAVARAWRIRASQPEFIMALLSYGITMSFLSHSYSFYPYLLIFLVLSAARVMDGAGSKR